MGGAFFHLFWITLSFSAGFAASGQSTCAQWLEFTLPSVREWNRAEYESAQSHAATGQLPLAALDTPEKIFAFADSLNPSPTGFLEQIQAIEALGGKVQFRNFRLPLRLTRDAGTFHWRWVLRHPISQVKSEWRRLYMLPYLSREARSIITTANAPPSSPQELCDWLTLYASQLALYRNTRAAGRSPWLPTPWRPAPFPARALDSLEASESMIYSTLSALVSRYPEVRPELAATDGVWKWRTAQLLIGLPIRVVLPYYDALAPYRPNQESWNAWKAGRLRALLEQKYHARLQWKWLIDRYRGTLLGMALVSVPLAGANFYQEITSGEVQERWQQIVRDFEKFPELFSRKRINGALQQYEENVDGDPDVVEHYDSQILALEESIEKSGDPSGSKKRQIEALKISRDRLKN